LASGGLQKRWEHVYVGAPDTSMQKEKQKEGGRGRDMPPVRPKSSRSVTRLGRTKSQANTAIGAQGRKNSEKKTPQPTPLRGIWTQQREIGSAAFCINGKHPASTSKTLKGKKKLGSPPPRNHNTLLWLSTLKGAETRKKKSPQNKRLK